MFSGIVFFKQKTAYDMRIMDWSSDVCSSDLDPTQYGEIVWRFLPEAASRAAEFQFHPNQSAEYRDDGSLIVRFKAAGWLEMARSEEHTSELQSLMRISYAVFCLKKKIKPKTQSKKHKTAN